MKPIISGAEKKAIEAVKTAIKSLPRGIVIEVDSYEGEMLFWKRTRSDFVPGIRVACEASKALKCKRVFCL